MARKLSFTKRQVINQGGMAVLTLVVLPDGKPLVLRELQPKLRWSLWMHRRFLLGAKIRQLVTPHPNIIGGIEYGYHGLRPYELIDYCHDSLNLNELILRKDPRVRSCSLEILRQASAALAHMHSKGYVHLDVKTENFQVMETEACPVQVQLTDFDLSRKTGSMRNFLRSGTLNYMSPEMLRSGTVGVEADIFAFGIVAYHLVTGRKPFSGFSLTELRQQQFGNGKAVPEPLKLNPDMTPKLSWIIMRCLEKDPGKRFPSMGYLQQELSTL